MSDSDLLGIIARNPVKKTEPPKRFRPQSPPAAINPARYSGLKARSPSPPPSPEPLFRRSLTQDDIHADDSASVIAELLDGDNDAYDLDTGRERGSVLFEVMRNDVPDKQSLLGSTTAPPFPRVPDRPPPVAPTSLPVGYGLTSYDLPDPVMRRPVGLPFQTVQMPTVRETSVPTVQNPQQSLHPQAAPVVSGVGMADMYDSGGYGGQSEIGAHPAGGNWPPREPQDVREKEKLVAELFLKRNNGHDVPAHISVNTSIDELRSCIENVRRVENHKRTLAMLRYLMIIGCTGVEKASMKFLSDMYLDGWAETVAANQSDYDDVLGRIAETADMSSIPPHLELVAMLGVSGVLFHMANKNKAALEAMIPPPAAVSKPKPVSSHAPESAPRLTEEQLRIHEFFSGRVDQSPRPADQVSVGSTRSATRARKRARIAIDSDEIVRLF